MNHMKTNKLFTNEQHGFLPNRSCVTQLLLIINHWTKLLDEGNCIDSIYLDFSKAFDSVPHERLLLKLQKYGIRGKAAEWIRSFLTDRHQQVKIKGSVSDWTPVLSGVPQGSVLGPLLFLIFINDLPDTQQNFIKIFADDTKIYGLASHENHSSIQKDLDSAFQWSNTWNLPFNTDKCKVMHIGRRNPQISYSLPNGHGNTRTELYKVSEEKDLGVTFDQNLSFKAQIANSASKANQMTGVVKRSIENLDTTIFLPLYKALIRPHLEYANVIWRPYKKIDITKIEAVQRRATKSIPSLVHLEYPDRLKTLGLPSLEYRRARGDMIQTYKIVHNLDDIDPTTIFTFLGASVTRGHSLRLKHPRPRLDLYKYSFACRVVGPWNELPSELVHADSLNIFKNLLDKHWCHLKYVF